MPVEYKVIVGWDAEAQAFVVVESDIEGLWLEDASFEGLVEKIRDAAPDLVAHNHDGATGSLRILREVGERLPLTPAV